MKYVECINFNNRNQLGKVLEYYFYEKMQKDYVSIIEEEEEHYDLQCPIPEKETNVIVGRLMNDVGDFIVSVNTTTDQYELDAETFSNMFLNLDPAVDKVMALFIALLLDKKDCFESSKDFYETAMNEYTEMGIEEESMNKGSKKIDTSNLKTGMIVNNYKELCEKIKQPVKPGGNSRKAQLKEFKCYFDWEKSGRKFIITDVYDTPLTKEDKRKLGNNSIYVQCIELILLQYLSQQTKFTRSFTKKKWWNLLGITSEKYGNVPEQDLKKLDYSVTSYEIKHFYQRCNKKLDSILLSALRNLRNRRLIEFEPQTIIVIRNEKGEDKHFAANDEEKKRVLNAERYILRVMGFETMTQMFMSFKQKEFYEKVNTFLNESCGWHQW